MLLLFELRFSFLRHRGQVSLCIVYKKEKMFLVVKFVSDPIIMFLDNTICLNYSIIKNNTRPFHSDLSK